MKTKDKDGLSQWNDQLERISEEIELSATFSKIYTEKMSIEAIRTKINNQLNAMQVSMYEINPKFNEKSKNYDFIKEEMVHTLSNYETVLTEFAKKCDEPIEELILTKSEKEKQLLTAILEEKRLEQVVAQEKNKKNILNTVLTKIKNAVRQKEEVDVSLINQLKDNQDIQKELQEPIEETVKRRELEAEIKKIEEQIETLNQEKISQIMKAMEIGDNALITELKKPKKWKKIKKFFTNRWNSHKIIMKNVIEPMNQRIEAFKIDGL